MDRAHRIFQRPFPQLAA